ncbi:MAG: 30S ribosomal protein S1 [Phycisphaerales bacterium JB043]
MTPDPDDTTNAPAPAESASDPSSENVDVSDAHQQRAVNPSELESQAKAAMDELMSTPEVEQKKDDSTPGPATPKPSIRGPRVVQGGREHRKGMVVSVGPEDIFLEFGPKELGVVARSHFTDESLPKVGDSMQVVVQRVDADQNLSICVPPGAIEKADWEKLEPGQVIEATCVGHNKGGLEMEVAKHRAFLPASKIDIHRVEKFELFVGQKFPCQVVSVDRAGRGNIVLSRRDLLLEERTKQRDALKETLKKGDVVTGRITRVMDYGAFVDIGGVDGLIHVSDLSYDRVHKASQVVKEGDEVRATILKIEWDESSKGRKDRIALGLKQAMADPFKQAQDDIKVGEVVSGKVTKILEFGCFVEVAPGVEGLVHISEIAWKRIGSVQSAVSVDQIVNVKVLDIDEGKRRIGLSIKQTSEPPKHARESSPHEEREESSSLRRLREQAKSKPQSDASGGLGSHGSLSGLGLGDIAKLLDTDD